MASEMKLMQIENSILQAARVRVGFVCTTYDGEIYFGALSKQKAAPPCLHMEDEWRREIFGRKVLINKAPDDSFRCHQHPANISSKSAQPNRFQFVECAVLIFAL